MRRALVLALCCAVMPAITRAEVPPAVWSAAQIATGGGGSARGSGSGSATGSGGGSALPFSGSDIAVDDLDDWAGSAQPTTLPELLQSALAHAPALASATLDVEIAEAQVRETWARTDWAFRAQLFASHTGGTIIGGVIPISSSDSFGGSADVSRTFSTGGTVDLHVGMVYTKSGAIADLHEAAESYWQDNVTLELSQPLLRGAGKQLFYAQQRRAELQHDVAALARDAAAITAIQSVVSAYWDLVLAERQVAITRASLDLARERLRVTMTLSDAGKTARSEIPAVQQIIATREEDVLNGELAVLNASIALRRAAGMPIGAGALGLRVAPDVDVKDGATWNVAALSEQAFRASPQLAELTKQGAQSTIDIEVARNGLLPQLDAALALGPAPINQSFSGTLANLAEMKQFAVQGSLTFSRSLHEYDAHARIAEATGARDKVTVNAADVRAQIAQGMATSVAQVELAQRRVQLSQRAIDLANENIRIETDRFNLGRSTNFDVLNRLEDLRQAELRKTQAMVDWQKARATVLALTTELLPTYGIQLK